MGPFLGEYNGTLFARRDAGILSWGGIDAHITAGRDAGMLAVDHVVGSIDAERYAGLISWGSAAGPMVVDGAEGAGAWVYKDFVGEVRSEFGDAFLVVYGNAVGASRLAAGGRDAGAWVVGTAVGDVQAGEYAGVVTLGDYHGTVTAGEDAFIASEGFVNANMDTGGDLWVYSYDGVAGSYHAGRDAAVRTYGDFDASLRADRDVGTGHYNYYGTSGVWAGGDVNGTISMGRNAGHWDQFYDYEYEGSTSYDVFSYGSINAVISAENPTGSPLGGRIGSVSARGAINGLIRATHSIQTVRSGGAVNAAVVAPHVGSIVENSTSLQNMADPELPPSIKDEILNEAAEVYDEILADRQQLADDIEEAIADFAEEKAAALAQLEEYKVTVDVMLEELREQLIQRQADEVEAQYLPSAGLPNSPSSSWKSSAARSTRVERKRLRTSLSSSNPPTSPMLKRSRHVLTLTTVWTTCIRRCWNVSRPTSWHPRKWKRTGMPKLTNWLHWSQRNYDWDSSTKSWTRYSLRWT